MSGWTITGVNSKGKAEQVGPYSEWATAQEKTSRLKNEGWRGLRIDKTADAPKLAGGDV